MTQFSDSVRTGDAYYPKALNPTTAGGERENTGVPYTIFQVVDFGAVAAKVTNGIVASVSATGTAVTLGATGSLVSSSIATFDVARCVGVNATSDHSFGTYKFTGTDWYGETIVSQVAGPTGTTEVRTPVSFKTVSISQWVATATAPSAVNIGSSNELGLKWQASTLSNIFGLFVNGVADVSPTFTAGALTTSVPTATTVDVRGKVLVTTTLPDAAKRFTVNMTVTPDSKLNLYGVTPYGG